MAAVKCEDVKNELTILAKYEREEAKLQAMLQSLRKQISDKKDRIAQLFGNDNFTRFSLVDHYFNLLL